jgi:arylsulfatase A-like enzyme
LVSQIDVAPSLLDACGISAPASFQGHSFMPLVNRDVKGWPDEVFIQISESMTGRALRTPEWTYVVARTDGSSRPSSSDYEEYQLYNLYDDPHQLVNLAGRADTSEISRVLRARLLDRMLAAGEPTAQIKPKLLYP